MTKATVDAQHLEIRRVQASDQAELGAFECGDDDLNGFLRDDALRLQERNTVVTYLALYNGELAGYVSLMVDAIVLETKDVALARFLDRFIDHMESKRGMIDALRAMTAAGGTPINESLAMVRAAVAPVIEAGKTQKVLREDVTVDDFIAVKGAIATTRPANARRLAVILVDGLRYRGSVSGPRAATKRAGRVLR